MQKTKMIFTIGPASDNETILTEFIKLEKIPPLIYIISVLYIYIYNLRGIYFVRTYF